MAVRKRVRIAGVVEVSRQVVEGAVGKVVHREGENGRRLRTVSGWSGRACADECLCETLSFRVRLRNGDVNGVL